MRWLVTVFSIVQSVLALRVVIRLVQTANGDQVRRRPAVSSSRVARVSVLVPVLDEVARLGPCLDGLVAHGPEVSEILVIDGGSRDGTIALIDRYAKRDSRVRLVDASPVPPLINGKAHGLVVGLAHSSPSTAWVLTIDADVRLDPLLASSLLEHADEHGLRALSAATQQCLSGNAEGLLHPSLLATLVYRFGIPGSATDRPDRVQANGQCFLVRRDVLDAVGGFKGVTTSVCEDVTLARMIAATGTPVGFYETEDLISVHMYATWREAWDNWTRSLPMNDSFTARQLPVGLAEVLLIQALPPWLFVCGRQVLGGSHPLVILNGALVCVRLGMLAGMARAYQQRPWTYWLSPTCDLPVAFRLLLMSRRRQHTWRGREFVTGATA